LNWLVYIIPPLAIIGGIYILYRALRSWQRPQAGEAPVVEQPETGVDDEYLTRIEEELNQR
jgi:hypothetical protein